MGANILGFNDFVFYSRRQRVIFCDFVNLKEGRQVRVIVCVRSAFCDFVNLEGRRVRVIVCVRSEQLHCTV